MHQSSRKYAIVAGFGVGLLVGLVLLVPGLASPEPTTKDPGRAMAEAAGCDLSQDDIPMNVGTYDSYFEEGKPMGMPTVEEAVATVAADLAADGVEVSDAALRSAAASADKDENPIQVSTPGVSLSVAKWGDGTYSVTQVIACA